MKNMRRLLSLLIVGIGASCMAATAQTADRLDAESRVDITSPALPTHSAAVVDTVYDAPTIDSGTRDLAVGDELTWNPVDQAQVYHVQISDDPSFTGTIRTGDGASAPAADLLVDDRWVNGTSYTVELQSSGTYYWRVRGISFDPGPWSAVGTFNLMVASVEDRSVPDLVAGPNPCRSCSYRITSPTEPIVSVVIHDVRGTQVRSLETDRTAIVDLDLSGLPSGLYHIRLEHATGKVSTQSVVVVE